MKVWFLLAVSLTCILAQDPEYPPPVGMPDFDWATPTLLDTYVHTDDGYFGWELLDVYNYSNVDVYIVNMTSQKWLDETRVSRSIWWHQMGIAIPHDVVNYTTAFLFIDGGSNSNPDDIPGRNSYFNLGVSWMANSTGCVAGYMRQVPNQPIVFHDDPTNRSRSEDRIIAYTWKWVLDRLVNGTPPNEVDREIVLRLPMTKAGNRGMDAVAQVASTFGGPEFVIDKFVIAGASKRGWTAWSVAATDQRVIATIPLVMSLLWFEETLQKHQRGYNGGWSFAFAPYFDEGLTRYLTDPIAEPIFDLEDMFRYRGRLAGIPKLAISATGDEFFLLQDSHNWWQYLGGIKHLMMNPNAEHTLFPHWLRIFQTVLSWFQIVVTEGPTALPQVSWVREEFPDSGRVTLTTDQTPDICRGLRSETLEEETIRDFRLISGYPEPDLHPVWWIRNETVAEIEENVFEHDADKIDGDNRWVGHYIECEWRTDDKFDGDGEISMWFSSEVNIIPDTYPGEECTGDECIGFLM